MEEAKKQALEQSSSVPPTVVLMERGIGLNYDSFMASFHKDYSSYTKLMDEVKKNPNSDRAKIDSFIVNLDDEVHYRYLTFSILAKHKLSMQDMKKK